MKQIVLLIGLVGFVLLTWVSTIGWLHDDPDRGTFGDMFGPLNALYSGLAFVGLIVAILMQKDELKLQRQELEETRKELKGQREQLEAQNKTLQHQNFENTFFQLLRLQNEIVNSIDIVSYEGKLLTGRDCFEELHRRLQRSFPKTIEPQELNNLEFINQAYLQFYRKHQAEIGHYFRNLYNTVKFVDLSDTPDKRLYTNLIRAQLSSYELVLLFYNTLSELGCQKFKPLIEKYTLLKTLDEALLFESDNHKKLLKESAFEKVEE